MRKPPQSEVSSRVYGDTVRSFRRRSRIAQERLALESGIDRAHMSKMERGKGNPTLDTIVRVAFFLNVSLADFFTEFDAIQTRRARQR